MVIQIIDQANVLREVELIIEEPHFHLTANQKTNKASLNAQKLQTVFQIYRAVLQAIKSLQYKSKNEIISSSLCQN